MNSNRLHLSGSLYSFQIMKNNITTSRRFCAFCLMFLTSLLITGGLYAAPNPPSKLTYQGFLTDQNGAVIGASAPVNKIVIFRIYNHATGVDSASLKWTETQTVTVDKGHFSVLLGEGGEVTPEVRPDLAVVFSGADVSDRYIEITVVENSVATKLMPRMQFLPGPYAFLAQSANQVIDPTGAPVLTTGTRSVGINKSGTPASALDVGGTITATGLSITGVNASTEFRGDGSRLTALNAANIVSGKLDDALLNSPVTAGASLANNATHLNAVTQIVRRDASGNFSAGSITATTFNGGGTVPIGGIIMWSGDTAPDGWAICDGRDKTPDLRGRFVMGAGPGPFYNRPIGERFGAESFRFTISIAQMPSHTHRPWGRRDFWPDGPWDMNWGNNAYYAGHRGDGAGGAEIYDTHPTGGGQPIEIWHMPPTYVLAFIQRIR